MVSIAVLSETMTPHSANELNANPYLGTFLVNGVLCHRWFDGTVLPLLFGGAGDDDGDKGDESDDDADADSDDEDSDDDDDPKGKKKVAKDDDEDEDEDDSAKTPSARRSARQAAARRIKIKELNATLAGKDTEIVDLKAKVAKYEKDGAGDPELKTANEKLQKDLDKALDENKSLKAEKSDLAINSEVEDIVKELKISQSLKMVKGLLREEGKLKLDDDGELEEDLTRSIKRLVKSGELTVKKVASGDEEEEDESGAPSRSSGSQMRRGGGVRTVATAKQLEKKYPALQR